MNGSMFADIRAGRVVLHREWMIRAFALGLAVATMRLIFVPALLIMAGPTDGQLAFLSVASFTTAFVMHASVADLWIRLTSMSNTEAVAGWEHVIRPRETRS